MINPYFVLATVVLAAMSLPAVFVVHWGLRRIGHRRNAANRCSRCGTAWTQDSVDIRDAHLVEGLLVCGNCAGRLSSRTRWALGAAGGVLGWITITAWGGAFFQYHTSGMWYPGWTYVVLSLPPLVAVGVTARFLMRMRNQNRRALESLGRSRLLGDAIGTTANVTPSDIGPSGA